MAERHAHTHLLELQARCMCQVPQVLQDVDLHALNVLRVHTTQRTTAAAA
jgi:hypothetical protein